MSEDNPIHNENYISVRVFALFLGISDSTAYNWIKIKKVKYRKLNGKYQIDLADYTTKYPGEYLKYRERYSEVPYVPSELYDYMKWHEVIDYISWLLKICYTPLDEIKKKKFRIDTIFQNYFRVNNIEIDKVSTIFQQNDDQVKNIIDDLKRGWYYELSYIFPLKESTLGLSYSDIQTNTVMSDERFIFPSNKIISFYYSIYFYLRAITLMKYPNFRKEEHKSTINCFKNNLFEPLKKSIWKFPLDLAWLPNKKLYRKNGLPPI